MYLVDVVVHFSVLHKHRFAKSFDKTTVFSANNSVRAFCAKFLYHGFTYVRVILSNWQSS